MEPAVSEAPTSTMTATAEERAERFAYEVAEVNRQLRRVRELLHPDDSTTSHRGLLEQLRDEGPSTMPMLARARGVSRQHVQSLVRKLTEQGFLKESVNPKHRRSSLLTLTESGKRLVERSAARERALFDQLIETVDERELRKATRVLTKVAEALSKVDEQGITRARKKARTG